jgi:hypothetical protein
VRAAWAERISVQPEARRLAFAGRILDDIEGDAIPLLQIAET